VVNQNLILVYSESICIWSYPLHTDICVRLRGRWCSWGFRFVSCINLDFTSCWSPTVLIPCRDSEPINLSSSDGRDSSLNIK
jgi:hypothetical protein